MEQLFHEMIDEKYYYTGDLGCIYTKESTKFCLWAPTASYVRLKLYKEGTGDNVIDIIPMVSNESGTWGVKVPRDLNLIYYTYEITQEEKVFEVIDPYAKAAGLNGIRGMVIDFDKTNPTGWEEDKRVTLSKPTDAIIYEINIRDMTADDNSGSEHPCTYLGLTKDNTYNKEGHKTGLAHLKELGITHVHILPCYDFNSLDEALFIRREDGEYELDHKELPYNWGYDPLNYNVLEGSYSLNPVHGEVRIQEFKQLVMSLHKKGIGVIMDVVYNHTALSEESIFHKILPNYYYRMKGNEFSDGSACGNEIASERKMVRKYIIDSVKFWAREYHLDGFRFDLMGLMDITTMNEVRRELDTIHKGMLIYGEGWRGGETILEDSIACLKTNVSKLDNIAVFSDDFRDTVKGSVFDYKHCGFVNGGKNMEEALKQVIAGGILSYGRKSEKKRGSTKEDIKKNSLENWSPGPSQVVNYVSAHDDLTLWDKLLVSAPMATKSTRIKMNLLAAAITFTSQGIPFFLSGEELLRSKHELGNTRKVISDSYKSCEEINQVEWLDKTRYYDVVQYYKGLIKLRKTFSLFRLESKEEIQGKLHFYNIKTKGVVVYSLEDENNTLLIILNGRKNGYRCCLPKGKWDVLVDHKKAGTDVLWQVEGKVKVSSISCMVLKRV